jgi:Ca2+-binding RTX toxin-like protein
MTGGVGDDVFFIDNPGDAIVEVDGEGRDVAKSSVDYVLATGVDVELLQVRNIDGLAPIRLTGNDLDNGLLGNAGANRLDGGDGGLDRLKGLAGDDIYFVEAGDIVLERSDGGKDIVKARESYALNAGAYVEILQTANGAGTDAINLTGNEFDQSLLGNAGNNILDGGVGGIDRLKGFAGDDVYYVRNGDIVIEDAAGGHDLVKARSNYVLNAEAEVDILSTANSAGVEAINLTGNQFDNRIIGNAGDNVLKGWLGSDVLLGNAGADRFVFNAVLGPANVDEILDFTVGVDEIALDDALFGLPAGALAANAFVIGSAAGDADDRIIYNSVTGALFFDADGSGGGAAQVQFAILDPGLALTSADFVVI